LVYPQIDSTDLDNLRLLRTFDTDVKIIPLGHGVC
jgi:hypothetical protein